MGRLEHLHAQVLMLACQCHVGTLGINVTNCQYQSCDTSTEKTIGIV